jgi:hypothetical protein
VVFDADTLKEQAPHWHWRQESRVHQPRRFLATDLRRAR